MTPVEVSERAFEDAIECSLLRWGPDACAEPGMGKEPPPPPYGEGFAPGRYHRRSSAKDYDRDLCLIPRDVVDFIVATQPRMWSRLKQHHGAGARDIFLARLRREIGRRGSLDVFRKGVKDSGCSFNLAYFRPASGLNEETRRLHAANIFSVVRQLRYSAKTEHSLDLALFLNGIPFFTVELKNPLTGQDVEDAIRQYRNDRDPREPLFARRRCLAHFAVDPRLAYVTTRLQGSKTRFLPFNRGRDRGAGNPPVPPTRRGYSTDYLWDEVWARDSVLDLIRQFIHEVKGNEGKRRSRRLIFPRYQQLDAVRKMVSHARRHGPGRRYLIQHSAGSGKSFTIAWLAHQLSTLHDDEDRSVFDSIVVITDRRVLDRQLQRAVSQFEQTPGVVENIDKTSRQLREALESGRRIIVTTLQKFPVIAEQIGSLPGKSFAVIVDEAHSSQSGESSKSLKAVLASGSLEAAEAEEAEAQTPEEELEATILREMAKRGPMPNQSTFAFTATPKKRTRELFGVKRADGAFKEFHLYSMRQAIEEGFILDVLANYTTYTTYWKLFKTIDEDPQYERRQAAQQLQLFAELHPHAIARKVEIMVGHFASQVQDKIGGEAKAMIVTRSRLHAVRYKRAVDAYLAKNGHPWKCLVAFSGKVEDRDKEYTESGMNSDGTGHRIGESQTSAEFAKPEYRFLVVANKFQTGFDQPLLYAMYVDKKLGGVNAVQTLSRLNRTHEDKDGTTVLDFANEAEDIRTAFQPHYETTLLSEATDPNLLYDFQGELLDFNLYSEAEVDAFARVYFGRKATQDQLYTKLEGVVTRFRDLDDDERSAFRSLLRKYNRLYSFLAQILTFSDADLEKLHVFARHLRPLLPGDGTGLPDLERKIDMESYHVARGAHGGIALQPEVVTVDPRKSGVDREGPEEDVEALSRIIAELNEQFGLDLGPEHRVTLQHVGDGLDRDSALAAAARAKNTRENIRLTFNHKFDEAIQNIVECNFDLYKRITEDEAFGRLVKERMFERYQSGREDDR